MNKKTNLQQYLNLKLNEPQLQALKALEDLYGKTYFNKQVGVYLWGGPGRGKTMLMDCLYQFAEIPKLRLHYHEFLQQIHQRKAQTPSLDKAICDWLQGVRLVCFDEFHMHDIADTVLMGRFLEIAVKLGIKMVLTSNYPPDDLMAKEEFHVSILPVITLVHKRFKTIHLDGSIDYRFNMNTNATEAETRHYFPLDTNTEIALREAFYKYDPLAQNSAQIQLNGRMIDVIGYGPRALWMEFVELCLTNRSHLDYLEMAQRWQVIVVSNIRQQDLHREDALQRFIWLVDVLYDKQIVLLLSAEKPLENMLTGLLNKKKDLSRTQSRLKAMQFAVI